MAVLLVALAWKSATASTASGDLRQSAGSSPATAIHPELQQRFAEATAAAAEAGVTMSLTSGWRTAQEQEELVAITLARYGSEAEAHRWVLPADRSAHVAGLAIDVGPTEGALWLEQNGAAYGLCRTYANEVWHFEPVIAPGGTCPPMAADSSGGWTD